MAGRPTYSDWAFKLRESWSATSTLQHDRDLGGAGYRSRRKQPVGTRDRHISRPPAVAHAFDELAFRRIDAIAPEANHRSLHLVSRLRFCRVQTSAAPEVYRGAAACQVTGNASNPCPVGRRRAVLVFASTIEEYGR